MAHASIKRSARYQTLKRAYASAKRDRRTAGLRFKKSHTAAHRAAYHNAEAAWQSLGSELGSLTGTHQTRRRTGHGKKTHIFSKGWRNVDAKKYSAAMRKSRTRHSR